MCVEGWGGTLPRLRRQCLRGSGRGLGCFRDMWVMGLFQHVLRGPEGFSPVQGPYCQARSNCLSNSSSTSLTLRGWISSSATTGCSSGLPRTVPCRVGSLPLASQLSHGSSALTAPLPLSSATRPGVGGRGHTSFPLYCPRPPTSHVPWCPLLPPSPHLRDLALVPASPCCVQWGPPSSSLLGRSQ